MFGDDDCGTLENHKPHRADDNRNHGYEYRDAPRTDGAMLRPSLGANAPPSGRLWEDSGVKQYVMVTRHHKNVLLFAQ